MTHVFEGTPDTAIQVSRLRPQYRALSFEEKELHDAIKAKACELEVLFEKARDLRCPATELSTSLAEFTTGASIFDPTPLEYFYDGMKSLELAVMWTVKGLTA